MEWQDQSTGVDDLVRTLTAFANDWANLGGGCVAVTSVTGERLMELRRTVIEACRDRVTPSIAPLVEELPGETLDRYTLLFTMVATSTPHRFHTGDYCIRVGSTIVDARNGLLLQLLTRKGGVDPWDRRPCQEATVNEIDLLVLREALQRMGIYHNDMRVEDYVSHERSLHALVPPLCAMEPLTGILRPRNFTLLLFGRRTQFHVPGAFSVFSVYPGTDRSTRTAERYELTGTLLQQAERLLGLLKQQNYPPAALREMAVNALVHRDYDAYHPLRVTAFSDRIEFLSPGSLPLGVAKDGLATGHAPSRWRNQTLAWFFRGLNLAQAEGQGIKTTLLTMSAAGHAQPQFCATETDVMGVLPALAAR